MAAPMVVALLRGINVGGHKQIAMADLRELAEGLGFESVATYIQSGNLVFGTKLAAEKAALKLEAAIQESLGHEVDVIARSALEWTSLRKSNPFPEAAEDAPSKLMLLVPDRKSTRL